MENDQFKQPIETQQRIDNLKAVNEKLLRRYLVEKTKSYWENALGALIVSIVFCVTFGIVANRIIQLGWPVIIVFSIILITITACDAYNAYPLSKWNIALTPVHELRQTLVKFGKRDRITVAVLLPFFLVGAIWLAFELREAFYNNYYSEMSYDVTGDFAFWCCVLVGVMGVVGSLIYTYYLIPKRISELIAEIDELNGNEY